MHGRGFCAAFLLAFGLLAQTSAAQELSTLPEGLASKVEAARQACADFDNGQFAMEWGAVSRVDLDGDLRLDWVLDESTFACSTAASLFCGTGGCVSHFLLGGTVTSMLNQGWDVMTFGRHRVLVLDVHGSRCGGVNPTPCVESLVWDQESAVWRSIQPEVKQ